MQPLGMDNLLPSHHLLLVSCRGRAGSEHVVHFSHLSLRLPTTWCIGSESTDHPQTYLGVPKQAFWILWLRFDCLILFNKTVV